jgi:hypothetical protein
MISRHGGARYRYRSEVLKQTAGRVCGLSGRVAERSRLPRAPVNFGLRKNAKCRMKDEKFKKGGSNGQTLFGLYILHSAFRISRPKDA